MSEFEGHYWTPAELKKFGDTYRDGYWLWGQMEKEHPEWDFQKLASEYVKEVVKQPRVENYNYGDRRGRSINW